MVSEDKVVQAIRSLPCGYSGVDGDVRLQYLTDMVGLDCGGSS